MRLVNIVTVPLSFRLMKGQARYFAARGVECHAVSAPGELAPEYAASEPVSVHTVQMHRRFACGSDCVALLRLWRLLRRLKPDVVQASTPKGGLLGIVAAWLARARVRIYLVRGLPLVTATGYRRRILQMTERVACAAATDVLVVSESVRRELVTRKLCPPSKATVLLGGSSNGVDCERFDPHAFADGARQALRAQSGIPADAVVIGYVGRLVRQKGILDLWSAWVRLREARPEAHLLLVGPFEQEDAVPVSVVREMERDTRVHVRGLQWDTPALYASMDVFCLPSLREGFPNVVLEASAMALPVVATRVPGTVDAVQDGMTGCLVPAGAPGALAEALGRYVTRADLRRLHGDAGRGWVTGRFRQEVIWAAWMDYFTAVQCRVRPVPVGVKVPGV